MQLPPALQKIHDYIKQRMVGPGIEPQAVADARAQTRITPTLKGTAGDIHNAITPTLKGEKEIIAFVTRLHDDWHQARYPYEVTWYLDIAYYLGLQWHSWSEAERGLREARSPSYRVRLVINRLMPTIRTLLGKVLRGMPQGAVYPLQTSEQSYADARVGTKSLKAQWRNLSLEDVVAEWVLWLVLTGTGFMKVGFDPDIGEELEGVPGLEGHRIGEICVDACSPFSILVSPDCLDMVKPYRCIHTKMVDIEILRQKYGDAVGALKPDESGVKENFYERRLATLVSPMATNSSTPLAEAHNAVYVSELWEDPEVLSPEVREEFPNGRVVVVAQQQGLLLSVHENPYKTWIPHESKLPFVRGRDDRVPGRFWGSSRLDQLIPIQKSYNKGRSQMVEARNLTCQPKINVEQGHGIARITNEPGQILERRKGFMAPTFMEPPQISNYHTQDIQDTLQDFQEVAQMQAPTRGQLPSANVPGYAVSLLQAADNEPLGPLVTEMAGGLGRMYQKVLERQQQFYDEERVLAFMEGDQYDVVYFLADRHQTPLRVEVTVESVMPESKASRMSRVQEALSTFPQLLDPNNPMAPVVYRLLELGNVDELIAEPELDRQLQGRENRAMSQGSLPKVEDYHNHAIHLAMINRFRKGPEWDALGLRIKALFDQHALMHIAALAKTVQNVASLPQKLAPQPKMQPPVAKG